MIGRAVFILFWQSVVGKASCPKEKTLQQHGLPTFFLQLNELSQSAIGLCHYHLTTGKIDNYIFSLEWHFFRQQTYYGTFFVLQPDFVVLQSVVYNTTFVGIRCRLTDFRTISGCLGYFFCCLVLSLIPFCFQIAFSS